MKIKLAEDIDGYVKKLVWHKWDTNFLEELVKQVKANNEGGQTFLIIKRT